MTKRKKGKQRGGSRRAGRVFSAWLREFASESDQPLVQQTEGFVASFRSLAQALPDEYGWRYLPVKAFEHQSDLLFARNLSDEEQARERNRLYWHDVVRSVEAYNILTLWRGAELLDVSVKTLNAKQVLPPAILARSLLELAVSFLHMANYVERITVEAVQISKPLVLNEQLEELLLKGIWGTRIGEPPEHVKQVNVLGRIKKLSQHPDAQDLLPTYEYLCEVAHPNVIGNARFQAGTDEVSPDGSVLIRLGRGAEFIASAEIREKTIWSIGWAAYAFQSGHEMLADSVLRVLDKWPR